MQVFDRNGDGYISKTELYQTMKELGVRLSMDDLNEMMRAADINQDGRIDYAGLYLFMYPTICCMFVGTLVRLDVALSSL